MPSAADLSAVEGRIWALLETYRSQGLVPSTIYTIPSLTWPGARAHDYFAAVKPGKDYVSVYLVAVDAHPEVLDGASPALLRRRTGKAAFTFPALDDELAVDLEALLARLFARYREDHAGT
jgi:hypothetical protein